MMKSHIVSFCATVALATVISAQNVSASPQDYEFQLVQDALPLAQDTIISVRLMHKPTGKPVGDAVIFATRLDMAPDGMPTMMADLEALPSEETGIYRYRTTLGMEGSWRLSLAAKVQGEKDTVQSRLVLKAKN
ncbi:FixH family protein [Afipia birgiae]|jgi:hypothetical protein|uniref:FixH family protein n=1 Tax=Afipia birgiae TaxID=151414 RepID=UPI00031F79CE|nr:FixH family protein [Afipia birgiae]